MRVTEQIAELKKELKDLMQQAKNTRTFLNKSAVSYERDSCPFCGKPREKQRSGGFTNYRQCDCEENRRAVEEWSKLLKQERDLTDRAELIREKLRRYEQAGRKLLEESNLGRRFQNRTFESFQTADFDRAFERAFDYAQGFETNRGEGLLFTGTPGTGKTHLAAAITGYIITELGIPVKFGSFIDILDSVKQAFGSEEDVIKELSEVPLLVIDDLGKERQTEWSNSILYQVINRRYENYLPVIITTNERMGDLERNIGKATMSRLIEMCDGVRMDGRDYRKEKLA